MKKSLLVLIYLLSIVLITGCSDQTNSNRKLQLLEDENKELKMRLDQVNSVSMLFQDYKDKQRFVPHESQIYALPIRNFDKLRTEKRSILYFLKLNDKPDYLVCLRDRGG